MLFLEFWIGRVWLKTDEKTEEDLPPRKKRNVDKLRAALDGETRRLGNLRYMVR
jgi:hypothetical protein